VDRLVADGHAVDVVDNLATGRRERVPSAARLHVRDLRDARLDAVVAAARPEVVVHVAAQAAVSRSVADPYFDASVNVLGTIPLLEACRRAGVRRAVYTSTGGPPAPRFRPHSGDQRAGLGANRRCPGWMIIFPRSLMPASALPASSSSAR